MASPATPAGVRAGVKSSNMRRIRRLWWGISMEVIAMDARPNLPSAAELAARGPVRFPNESPEYRAARTALLAEEIELRRHLERVARQRRDLPPGGEVRGDYSFEGEEGLVDVAGLFRDKQT